MSDKKLSLATKINLGIGTGALLLGAGIGASTVTPAAAPEPKTITQTVEKQVPTPVTPQSCTDALDAADRVNGIVARAFAATQSALIFIQQGDFTASSQKSQEIKGIATELTGAKGSYEVASAACRAEAK